MLRLAKVTYVDIPEFLAARYAEIQRLAEEAQPGPWRGDSGLMVRNGDYWDQIGEIWTVPDNADDDYPADEATAQFIAVYDPPFVLADIAVKRSIVEDYTVVLASNAFETDDLQRAARDVIVKSLRMILRRLASEFSEHPDFNPAWAIPGVPADAQGGEDG